MSQMDIQVEACRSRQQRVLEIMQRQEIDIAIFTQIEHVQYLAGPRFNWTFQPVVALDATGKLTLVAPSKIPPVAAADEILTYEAKWLSTMRNDQRQASSQKLLEVLGGSVPGKRVGVEFSSYSPHLSMATQGELIDLEPELYRLRRSKDPDELARIKKAIEGTRYMYDVAREIISPGVTEIEVFNALQRTAVDEYDEMMTGTGNDYQCCSRGGPPRGETEAKDGELYILDLGPAFRGYFADNARTIAVSTISDEQQAAWQAIMPVFEMVESTVRPGVKCKTIFEKAQTILDKAPVGLFNHHLGHGIGLFPHEGPHLNPNWDDTFEVGDVFTAEPGLYDVDILKAGMRIENDYLVTEDGVELLTDFPLEL